MTTGQLQHVAGVARRNEKDPARSTLTVHLHGRKTGSATFDGTIGRLDDALGIGDSATIPSAGSRFRGYTENPPRGRDV